MVEDLLIFGLANQRFGVPVRQVQEVVPRATLTSPPLAPPGLVGILRLRGELLPVVSLRVRLGLAYAEARVSDCIVVAQLASGKVGLLVDAVYGVDAVADLPPFAVDAVRDPSQLIQAMIERPGGVVTVLDAEGIATPELHTSFVTISGVDRRFGTARLNGVAA